jgi:hypothetical protein
MSKSLPTGMPFSDRIDVLIKKYFNKTDSDKRQVEVTEEDFGIGRSTDAEYAGKKRGRYYDENAVDNSRGDNDKIYLRKKIRNNS